ncbi:LAME_0G08548g1_1 [Lachancea meyersii CBS 8951]|uniref:LAME_0G08548g1_1 n=1 Tax=Lachancea meyersii CBS 8951 TaxID=1266667 RepID=A0A1G4K8A9_9SACH|nr:LAME_0G08548g1_1 [Lachancea meyersii CBS 8951]
MLSSQILRNSAATVGRSLGAAAPKSASRILLRASPKRIGQSWVAIETRRLVPAVLGWTAFITSMLGWPFAVRAFMLPQKLD